jgi:hypothetical protein
MYSIKNIINKSITMTTCIILYGYNAYHEITYRDNVSATIAWAINGNNVILFSRSYVTPSGS